MKEIKVKLQPDFIERITKVKKPLISIAEMVWNSVDADAYEVKVIFEKNGLGGIEIIRIIDNGHGINYEDGLWAFENLGGSKKKNALKSKDGRLLHGKAGKGRFRAYALGDEIKWKTTYQVGTNFFSYDISGTYEDRMKFLVSDPEPSKTVKTGTEVIIGAVGNHPSLRQEETIREFCEHFALYLYNYPKVGIWYDGTKIEPKKIISHTAEYNIAPIQLDTGETVLAQLTVIEWHGPIERSMYLCNANGFPLDRIPPGIQAPHYVFTAYLKSDYLQELCDTDALAIGDLHPGLQQVLAKTKEKLRTHFRERDAQNAENLVEQWKKEKVYPYSTAPSDPIEQVEQQVFNVLALNVNEYLPSFDSSEAKNKKLAFSLLKEALTQSPKALTKILNEVLELGKDKQEELAELLEKTTLTAIISASKEVASRLDFILGLESLVFDYKKYLKERSQLHKILENETWIFGESFNLTLSDQSLTSVLEKHLELLRGKGNKIGVKVLREDDSEGIVDLMLSRIIQHPYEHYNEHLVVELKRPSKSVDMEVAQQIISYATAVSKDERFQNIDTRWTYWAISNEISDEVQLMAGQQNRPSGLIIENKNLKIWAKSWSEIFSSCRARLKFFQEKLNYSANEDSALAYLKKIHSKYLPDEVGAEKKVNIASF